MKRLALKLSLFLLLGAIINVAVAWSLYAFLRVIVVNHQGVISFAPTDPVFWQTDVSSQPGALLIDAESWKLGPTPPPLPKVPSWSATRRPPTALRQGIREVAYGWPMLCVYSRSNVGWTGRENGLPRTPIWGGMAFNSLVFAIAAWVGFTSFRAIGLRRRIRMKRGLCPACAYPIGSSAVCTECGAAVTPSKGVGM